MTRSNALEDKIFRSTARISATHHDWAFSLLALALFMFPGPAGAYLVDGFSQFQGLLAGSIVVAVLTLFRTRAQNPVIPAISIAALVLLHFLPPMILFDVDQRRTIFSLVLLVLVLVASGFAASWMLELPDYAMSRVLACLRWMMVFIVLLSLAGAQPPTGTFAPKPIFPFREPSHFALVWCPLLLHACCRAPRMAVRLGWLIFTFAASILLENLTLVVIGAFAAAITLPFLYLATLGLASTAAIGVINTDYFVERLDFSAQTENLSALVYLQGWDIVSEAVRKTWGWGFGFQQLGFVNIRSPAGDKILRIYGEDTNTTDGGFMAAKIIGELGILGVIITTALVTLALIAAVRLRHASLKKTFMTDSDIYTFSICAGYTVDIFVRGTGWFSASSTLLFVAVLRLFNRRYR